MKKSVLFIAALMLMMAHSMSASASDKIIPVSQLPASAKAYVNKNFPGQTIAFVEVDNDHDGPDYKIHLGNGMKIEFDNHGGWEIDDFDHDFDDIHVGYVPPAIANYVRNHFSGAAIVKVDREYYGYEVELSNGLELKFNHNGVLFDIDD